MTEINSARKFNAESKIKILIYCYAFSPSVGGIETITETLAVNFTRLGHEVTVVTETKNEAADDFPFVVIRAAAKSNILKVIKTVDVIYNVELSLKFFLLAKIAGKPLIWIHNGYKLSCIDALGWYKDGPAPMTPMKSIMFYRNQKGLGFAIKEGFKLYVRRWAAKQIFCNVAATKWVDKRQPFNNQVQIYTPYPTEKFVEIAHELERVYDFLYVGRLVREKGVDTLLMAFKLLLERSNKKLRLAIVGYGSEAGYFENLSKELGVANNVDFLGKQKGQQLLDLIKKSEIGVVPSYWEEPMGGISLELLAAGKIVIVSKNGGMPEVVGEAGLTFANGNAAELSERMEVLVQDEGLRTQLKSHRVHQLSKFDPETLSRKYLELFLGRSSLQGAGYSA